MIYDHCKGDTRIGHHELLISVQREKCGTCGKCFLRFDISYFAIEHPVVLNYFYNAS